MSFGCLYSAMRTLTVRESRETRRMYCSRYGISDRCFTLTYVRFGSYLFSVSIRITPYPGMILNAVKDINNSDCDQMLSRLPYSGKLIDFHVLFE